MFTDHPCGGSPLAVVPDAAGLSTATMRAVAARSGATETAFVLPPTDPSAGYRVRVFTGDRESAGGGHSCVGTAATLVRLGRVPPGPVTQECGTGRQHLVAAADRATLLGTDPRAETEPDTAALLAAAGLDADALDPAAAAGRAGYGGARFPFLPVAPRALAAARPRYDAMAASDLPALALVAWDPAARTAAVRLFAPGFGIPEDPACGPVALALGVWLAEAGLLPGPHPADAPPADGEHAYTVRQGGASGHPSRLDGTVTVTAGRAVRGSVSGTVTPAGTLPGPAG
ncbi:PhzF family phenazine biosynthesis protein [Allostreptomyces psammosilenae]|uniref:Trans-2,3-dihydro-3-hydroxyanthranilate isomerase n=1 Tax=Allostreptomyces psammosilenae TaxID=1892865 RepID=A0A852ZTS0_9ACTN|nr:PhzF family phenazine biosynthesis isomerase [Allostreptomyces psammosilenae]NYI04680.1 trans-2,3-dihydro-3-hydroxyanthranilate isomerase [Allostreptomyces psammosilenae]